MISERDAGSFGKNYAGSESMCFFPVQPCPTTFQNDKIQRPRGGRCQLLPHCPRGGGVVIVRRFLGALNIVNHLKVENIDLFIFNLGFKQYCEHFFDFVVID